MLFIGHTLLFYIYYYITSSIPNKKGGQPLAEYRLFCLSGDG